MTARPSGERTRVRSRLGAWRVAALGVLGAAALVVAQIMVATSATAVPGLNRVAAASAVNSNTFKGITVNCPFGQRAVGGGASLSGGTTEVAVTQFAPLPGGAGFEARAYEDRDGFVGNWALTVYAVCANPLPGYEIQQATSPFGSPNAASVSASCSPGRQLLGTGAGVSPGRGVVVLTGSIPVGAPPTSVTAIGEETEGGFVGNWAVTAWAICAVPVPGHSVIAVSSALDSMSPKGASAVCPAGTAVHGTGMLIRGGAGQVQLTAVVPAPPPVPTVVRALGYEDQNSYAGNWHIWSYAICAI